MEKITDDKKILYFKNDDEFIIYALKTTPIVYCNNNIHFYDFDFTDEYSNAIKNNIFFKIENEFSSINKRKELNYRLIVKKIDNLI